MPSPLPEPEINVTYFIFDGGHMWEATVNFPEPPEYLFLESFQLAHATVQEEIKIAAAEN